MPKNIFWDYPTFTEIHFSEDSIIQIFQMEKNQLDSMAGFFGCDQIDFILNFDVRKSTKFSNLTVNQFVLNVAIYIKKYDTVFIHDQNILGTIWILELKIIF